MERKSILMLVAMLLPIAANVAGAADESKDLEGTWQGTSGAGGFKEIWTIKAEKDGWSISGIFKKDDKEVGAFKAKNVKFSDGTLTFNQEYSKKPNPTWADNTFITVKLADKKLAVTWENGGQKGTNTLERAKVVPLAGTWQGTSGAGGFTEMWIIKAEKDAYVVAGIFKKDDKEVGGFVGKDVKLADGVLSFTQQYLKKPDPGWADGTKVTAKVADGKLAVTWQNGKQKGTNTLERGDAVASDKDPPNDDKKLSAEAKKELEQLAGNWEYKSFLFNGKKIDFGAIWTFKDGNVEESIGGNSRRSGPVTLDPGKTPKEIDINFNKGPDGGAAKGLFKGIYELKDNTLTICIGSDQVRPTELESKEGSKAILMVFERKKK